VGGEVTFNKGPFWCRDQKSREKEVTRRKFWERDEGRGVFAWDQIIEGCHEGVSWETGAEMTCNKKKGIKKGGTKETQKLNGGGGMSPFRVSAALADGGERRTFSKRWEGLQTLMQERAKKRGCNG